tara:strand:- start:2670 stop:2858 length:189 start_codon:yes stop_codon:yes gene_type:complete
MMDRADKRRLQVAVHNIETIPELLELKKKIWAFKKYDAHRNEIQHVLTERQLFLENREFSRG